MTIKHPEMDDPAKAVSIASVLERAVAAYPLGGPVEVSRDDLEVAAKLLRELSAQCRAYEQDYP